MYRAVNKDFFKKWTPDMAYVLGFFAADGYMTINKRGGYFWNIQITDKRLLEQIRKVIDSGHKISKRDKSGNRSATYRLQIGSKEMYNDLLHLGMHQGKTKVMVVPNVPKKLFGNFVRGYFDGDGNVWVGYVHKERVKQTRVIRTVFTSASFKFLEALRNELDKNGIQKGVLSIGQGQYYRLTYSVHGSLKLYDFMYNSIAQRPLEICLKRKKVIFEQFIKMRS